MGTALIASIRCAASRIAGIQGKIGLGRSEMRSRNRGRLRVPKGSPRKESVTELGTGFRAPKNLGNPARFDHCLARPRPFVSNSATVIRQSQSPPPLPRSCLQLAVHAMREVPSDAASSPTWEDTALQWLGLYFPCCGKGNLPRLRLNLIQHGETYQVQI